ncbi:MAG: hypothetical protein EU536_03540 [Promethearchaeota archaeon]|nr:MAG: hypothetical protein EU536_03540 [Candidatus Lokiarchaeota archaeon]
MNIENIAETKKYLQELMSDVEKPGCDNKRIDELKNVLEKIGNNPVIYAKYQDIYPDVADALMFAGVSADDCKCDPLRNHTPVDKRIQP